MELDHILTVAILNDDLKEFQKLFNFNKECSKVLLKKNSVSVLPQKITLYCMEKLGKDFAESLMNHYNMGPQDMYEQYCKRFVPWILPQLCTCYQHQVGTTEKRCICPKVEEKQTETLQKNKSLQDVVEEATKNIVSAFGKKDYEKAKEGIQLLQQFICICEKIQK